MLDKELTIAIKAALEARKAILDVYNSSDLGVEIKDDDSPVTKADKRSDKIIREMLSKEFPEYGMLTEESFDNKERLDKDYVWIIDPLDGTKEFVNRNDEFAILIGLAYKHIGVLGVIVIPCTGEIYYAIEGEGAYYKKDENAESIRIHVNNKTNDLTALTSRYHQMKEEDEILAKHKDIIKHKFPLGAALKGAYIASGKAELTFRYISHTKEWDTCAMQVVVEQAGGLLLDTKGNRITYNREDVYNRNGYVIINRKENFLL